jgi:ABC-type glycerol-3-phosphate transport system substrate-binding protein
MRHTKSVKYVRASVALAAVAMTLAACSGGSSAPSAATALDVD